MKISILTPNLSDNCLGRAYLLAKVLQSHYKVEIIGPMFGEGIWAPVVNDGSITYKSVTIRSKFKPYWLMKKLVPEIDGDIIYASKTLFSSFGVGLFKKLTDSIPLILDIDDWQMGFMKESCNNLHPYRCLKLLLTPAYWNHLISEKLIYFADEITVSNNFLKEKFGGTVVYHGRDTEIFNPRTFDKALIREKYKTSEIDNIVMFFGTPREHKGIEDLIKAVELIKEKNIILIVVGIDDKNQYCINVVKTAKKMIDKRFQGFGLQPFQKVPEFLAMADVVVIPQKRNFATIGQMPAKVFDAMAMAKPIIATKVSDLPEVLDGCGWIVEPDNPKQLSETIQYVIDHPTKAEEIGRKSREKCIKKYSHDSMEKLLVKIINKFR